MGLVEKRSLVEVRSIYPGEFRGCVHFTPENFGAAVVVFSLSLSPHESQITSHPLRPLREVLFVICHLSCASLGYSRSAYSGPKAMP